MRFSSPKVFVFFLSLLFAVLAVVDKFNIVPDLPRLAIDQTFWLALSAYILLMLGNVLRGL